LNTEYRKETVQMRRRKGKGMRGINREIEGKKERKIDR
jgi:hypothetical protein